MANGLLALMGESSNQTVPSLDLPSDTIRPISPPPASPPTKISPAERSYLNVQANSIRISGGSEADIVNFVQNHVGLPPEERREGLVAGITETGGPEIEPSLVLGLPVRLYQGFSWGFGDDFIGTTMGLFTQLPGGSPPLSAQEGRDLYREILQAGTGNKFLDFVTEMAGLAVTGGFAVKALGAGTGLTMGAIKGNALLGGAGAALEGFGRGEGNVTERAKSALVGGVFGGTLGLGIGAVAAVGAPLVRAPARAIADKLKGLDMVQSVLPNIGTSSDHARRVILEVMESTSPETGISPINQLRQRVATLREAGVSPTLADAGDDTMLALMGETFNFRTPASQETFELIMERQAGQGGRLSGDMFENVFEGIKFGGENAYSAVDKLTRTMNTLAEPLYEESHRLMMPVSPRFIELMQSSPTLRASYEIGRRLGQEMDITRLGQAATTAGRLTIPEIPTGALLEAGEQGLLSLNLTPERMQELADLSLSRGRESSLTELAGSSFPTEIPIRAIDFMQQGLRQVKERLLNKPKGLDMKKFQALNDTLEEILEEAEGAASVFEEARSTWAGFSAARDAVEMGRGFSGKAPEVIRQEITRLGKRHASNADLYRLGVMQDIVETVRGPISKRESADVAREIFGGRLFREAGDQDALKIRALFDSDAASDDFMRRVVAETRLSRTATAAGNINPTSGSSFQRSVQEAEGALPFGRASIALNAYSMARQAMVTGSVKFRTRVADDMAVMFSHGLDNPKSLDTFIDSLEDFQLRELATKQWGSSIKGGLTIALSSGLARAFAGKNP